MSGFKVGDVVIQKPEWAGEYPEWDGFRSRITREGIEGLYLSAPEGFFTNEVGYTHSVVERHFKLATPRYMENK